MSTVTFVLGNLPFDTDVPRAMDFLSNYGRAVDVTPKRDSRGRFCGLVAVEMFWTDEVTSPADLQGLEFEGRQLDVLEGPLSIEDLGVRRNW